MCVKIFFINCNSPLTFNDKMEDIVYLFCGNPLIPTSSRMCVCRIRVFVMTSAFILSVRCCVCIRVCVKSSPVVFVPPCADSRQATSCYSVG